MVFVLHAVARWLCRAPGQFDQTSYGAIAKAVEFGPAKGDRQKEHAGDPDMWG
jgi:hypothetical protein